MSIDLTSINEILPFVSKPGRYVGGELNIVKKDKANVSLNIVMSYPDIYEVGMSNTAIQILYKVINDVPEYRCERVFAPWVDFEKKLRENNLPLYSLESYTPLFDFDILGFSIGYEMLYTNMLNIIDLGKIPVYSKNRNQKHPLVIAGGPGIFNPEPIADFIDVFIYGDGENAILEFMDIYKMVKLWDRYKQLKEFEKLDYCYIPAQYEKFKKGKYYYTKVRKRIKRKIEPDINKLPYPEKPIVPIIKTIQDRITVETTRGCTTGCRFCQAGFIYRPVRERSVRIIDKIVDSSIKFTGYDEISLAALSISDYTELYSLVHVLTDKYSDRNISISLPSLRINSTNIEILKMIQKVRKSGLTFAVESPDVNVRKRINKAINDDQLTSIIGTISQLGWKLIKLYFMIGLPMSSEEEIKIETFIKRLMSSFPKINVNVNVSLFVPKPHTPFERVNQMGIHDAEQILSYLRDSFRHSRVRIRYQNPKMSKIEAIISRGDREVSNLIYNVFMMGERFSSWDEIFDYDLWVRSASIVNLDINKYIDEIDSNIELPWDFIDTGVSKKFLQEEYEKAKNMITTENCIYENCPGCGVCRKEIRNVLAGDRNIGSGVYKKYDYIKINSKVNNLVIAHNTIKKIKILCKFKKTGIYKYFSHLDLINLFSKAGRRANLPFSYTEGFNPKPKIVVSFPLPLGVESEYELMELKLDRDIDPDIVVDNLNSILPKDLMILKAKLSNDKKSIASKSYCHDYFISSKDIILLLANLNRDIIKKVDLNSDSVLFGFDYVNDGIAIRLYGNMSLKKIFNIDKIPEMLSKTKRVKIWEVNNQKIYPFI